jgi:hypothetical protein
VQFGFNIYFGTAEIVDVPPSTGTPIGCDATIIDTSPWVEYGVAGDGGTTYRACVALKTTEVIDGSADMIAPMIPDSGVTLSSGVESDTPPTGSPAKYEIIEFDTFV